MLTKRFWRFACYSSAVVFALVSGACLALFHREDAHFVQLLPFMAISAFVWGVTWGALYSKEGKLTWF